MSGVPTEKLDRLVARWQQLQTDLSGTLDQQTYARLSKEFSDLDPVVATVRRLQSAERELEDLQTLLEDRTADREMRELAEEEARELEPRIEDLQQELRIQLLPKDEADERDVIIEVRAGNRRRRGGVVRRRPIPDVRPLCRTAGLEDRNHRCIGE